MVYCKSLRNIPMFILRKLCKYMCRKHSSLKINVYKFKDTYKVSFSRHFSGCIFCYMRIQIQENEFRNVQYFFILHGIFNTLMKLGGQQISNQIFLKVLDMMFIAIRYHLVKKPYFLPFNFEHFPIFLYRAFLLKEFSTV